MEEKKVIRMVQEPRKSELVKGCYGIVEAMFEVYKQLGPGMPEYIYQEALYGELVEAGYGVHKELEYLRCIRGKR